MVFNTTGIIIAVVFGILGFVVQSRLRSKFKKYSGIRLQKSVSGAEVAEMMLRDNGIYDVKVICVEGELTDHYNPMNKTVNLSRDVYSGISAAAVAVSAHECGHAVQHAQSYAMLNFRSMMVPAVNFSAGMLQWVILAGVILINATPIPLMVAIGLFSITTIFSVVTLPVEFDASHRALIWMRQRNIVTHQEHGMAKDALKWAAMTYVVAALASFAQLMHLVMMLLGSQSDD